MYSYIKGQLADTGENYVVVEAGGVGYELNVSTHCAAALSGRPGAVTVYTRLIVREDDMRLFGFFNREERAMFDMLITVSGLGPKLALAVLSGIRAENLAAALALGDIGALNAVKGVGKKTAERIVLELKDKVGKEYRAADRDMGMGAAPSAANAAGAEDAVMALMTLGYTRAESAAMVAKVRAKSPQGLSLEELVLGALKNS